jgi:pyridoxine/pyridoxamine 5'-phosphate oxidase
MKLAVLNTSIVTCDGTYTLSSITPETAIALAADAELDSAVGHDSTAAILSTILGQEVPVCRQLFAQKVGQQALVFKLNGRPEPGRELSRKELEEIGFTFKLLTRTA